MSRQKYFSKPTTCNKMHKHASKKEAARCDELTLLERAGKIEKLMQQPEFELQPKFKIECKTIRPIKYRADFSYYDKEENAFIVEDVKGFKTKDYMIKKKILLYIMRYREDWFFRET